MTENIWEKMKTNHAISGFIAIVTGIIITIFLWWFFGGFWFGELPGLAILFIGIAEILYIIYGAITDKKSSLLHAGFLILFISVAGYISFAGHVLLGTLQIISIITMVIGILLLIIGIISTLRT